jgi:hypothetical protein
MHHEEHEGIMQSNPNEAILVRPSRTLECGVFNTALLPLFETAA